MSGPTQVVVRILTSFLLWTQAPQLLKAQVVPRIVPDIGLSALTPPPQLGGPTVFSSVRATLINDANGQRLFSQLVAGHGVADLTANTAIYQRRLVSETGDASEQATISGVVTHCYETGLAAHVDAYNLHKNWSVGPICAEPYEPPPHPEVPKENCPVLLDLEQNGFHLSGPDPAVHFDIDADGTQDEIAWTEVDGDDAFLCWDRNRNGVIDDGRELFGYATLLMTGGPAEVGYRALAELDQPAYGGNGDGKVDADDPAFRELCAWIDGNRDGVSQSVEIHALREVGVIALRYRYRTTRLRDAFGNLFRYVSSAEMLSSSGAVRSWPTFDVIFAEPAASR
jgi:hypothetical protein